jgi:hypothetical protein
MGKNCSQSLFVFTDGQDAREYDDHTRGSHGVHHLLVIDHNNLPVFLWPVCFVRTSGSPKVRVWCREPSKAPRNPAPKKTKEIHIFWLTLAAKSTEVGGG